MLLMYRGKRTLDIVGASAGLLLLMPLFFVVALLVKLDSPGPVFFRQLRVGRGGRMFRIHKFRTMYTSTSFIGNQLTVDGDKRITRFGRFLRKSKVDELPQLFDVLRGVMSLVGPRPEVPSFVSLYPPELRKLILSVRPGITDLASIKFRDEANLLKAGVDSHQVYVEQILPVKLELCRQYVCSMSLRQDLCIILKTLFAVGIRD